MALLQNDPNPLTATTRMACSAALPGEVGLQIFDITGREVAILFRGFQLPGKSTAACEGAGLADGLCLCQLKCESHLAVIIMLLARYPASTRSRRSTLARHLQQMTRSRRSALSGRIFDNIESQPFSRPNTVHL